MTSDTEDEFRQRLTRYYQKYAPEKLSRVEEHLVKFAGQ